MMNGGWQPADGTHYVLHTDELADLLVRAHFGEDPALLMLDIDAEADDIPIEEQL